MSPEQESQEELPLELPSKKDVEKIREQKQDAEPKLWEGTLLEKMVKRKTGGRPALRDLSEIENMIELDESIEDIYSTDSEDMNAPELHKKITDISKALKKIEKKVNTTLVTLRKHEKIPEELNNSFWRHKPELRDWINEWENSDNEQVQKILDFTHANKYKELEEKRHELDQEIRKKTIEEHEVKDWMKDLAKEPERLKHSHLIDVILGIDYHETEKKLKDRDRTDEELQEKTKYNNWGGKDFNLAPYKHIHNFLEELDLDENDVFYDLGSGYGRPVFYSALTTDVKKSVGIELVPERVENCKEIKENLGLDNVEFRQGNVLDEDFSDGTVFFLFNPFNRKTENKLMEKLKDLDHDFKLVTWHTSFDNEDWLEKKEEVVAGTNPINIYGRKKELEENEEV